MADLTPESVLSVLKQDNPTAVLSAMIAYRNLFVEYITAQRNIAANGSMVAHPKTGEPITNPYIKIRDGAHDRMGKIRLKTDRLWGMYAD